MYHLLYHRQTQTVTMLPTTKNWSLRLMMLSAVLGVGSPAGVSNVARGKPAAQSTSSPRFPSLTASKAVDGDYTTSLYYCQHTADTDENDHNPTRWWMVDLQGYYEIASVQVTNRGDCCASRLRDYDIQVFTLNPMNNAAALVHTCYHYSGPMGAGVTELLQCNQPITGRYVRIIMNSTGQPMHVCEVEVLAKTPDSASNVFVRSPGHKAPGSLLREVTSQNPRACLVLCSSDVACNAVNLGPKTLTSAGEVMTCQLLSFGGIGQPDSTTLDPDWTFYTMADL